MPRRAVKRRRTAGTYKKKRSYKKKRTGRSRATSGSSRRRGRSVSGRRSYPGKMAHVRSHSRRGASRGAMVKGRRAPTSLISMDGMRFLACVRDPFSAPPVQIPDSFGSVTGVIKLTERFVLNFNQGTSTLWPYIVGGVGGTVPLTPADALAYGPAAHGIMYTNRLGSSAAGAGFVRQGGQGTGGFMWIPHVGNAWVPLIVGGNTAGFTDCICVGAYGHGGTVGTPVFDTLAVQPGNYAKIAAISAATRVVSAGMRMKYIGPHGDGQTGLGYLVTVPYDSSFGSTGFFGSDTADYPAGGGIGVGGAGSYSAFKSDPRTIVFRVGEDVALAVPMSDDEYLIMGDNAPVMPNPPAVPGAPWCPYSGYTQATAPSFTPSFYGATAAAPVSSLVVNQQTAGGRSMVICIMENVSVSGVAGATSVAPYEVEFFTNVEYEMTAAFRAVSDAKRCSSDLFAREAAAELWSKQGSSNVVTRASGIYGSKFEF